MGAVRCSWKLGGCGTFSWDLLSSRQLDPRRDDYRPGRRDREHKSHGLSVKDIYVYPPDPGSATPATQPNHALTPISNNSALFAFLPLRHAQP